MPDPLEIQPTPAPWRDALWIVLVAPALIAGCYSAGFVEFDDSVHYNHPAALADAPLSSIVTPTFGTYFPITVLSYRIDRWLYERVLPQPWPHAKAAPGVRFTSLILHILAGLFLWRAQLRLGFGRWMSLFAAAAWTAHPAACESVCWISERKNVLAAVFGFASLWVYFGGVRNAWLRVAATAALFVLGMLSKPNMAGFLPIYFLYDLYCLSQRRKDAKGTEGKGSALNRVLPSLALYAYCASLIVFLAELNMRWCQDSTVARPGGSLGAAALTDVPILTEYIYNSLMPVSLSIFYHSPVVTSLRDGLLWSRLLILLAIFAGTVWISANRWRTVFLWGWFVGALGPALNIVSIPYLMQDRYAYFSLPAILLIAAETLTRLVTLARPARAESSNAIGGAVAVSAAVCFALLAFFRSDVYRSDFDLFRDAVIKQPKSAYAQMHYALTVSELADVSDYAGEGDPQTIRETRADALKHFQAATQCDDFDRLLEPGRVRILIAVLKERLGQFAEAEAELREEMKQAQMPYTMVVGYQSLARIELQKGRADVALAWVDLGIRTMGDPQPSAEMLYLKGLCLERLNRVSEARAVYASIPAPSLAYKRAQVRLKKIADSIAALG